MTFNALRDDIVDGVLAPGSRLAVEHLRQRYGVGSSTIREALSLLIADALVTAEGQRGFSVKPMSVDDLRDLGGVRVLLETHALRESIANGDDDWEAGIIAAFHRLTRAQERLDAGGEDAAREWEERNRRFHDALTARCDSPWVRHMLDMLHHHSERYRRLSLADRTIPRDVHAEHRALMEATVDRDVEMACKIVTQHIQRTTEVIGQLAERDGDSPYWSAGGGDRG
jgi:DNA-binding GntR family transcriptional regulator